jgi:hypothetical protein
MGGCDQWRATQSRSVTIFGIAVVAASLFTSNANATLWISGDKGGTILEYAERYQRARDSGEQVVIDGRCISACTLVIGIVPRDRVCVTPKAILGFHAAYSRTSNGGVVASTDATKFLMNSYPPAVRNWIKQRGGLTTQMIFLTGTELATYVPPCPTTIVSSGLSSLNPFRLFSH